MRGNDPDERDLKVVHRSQCERENVRAGGHRTLSHTPLKPRSHSSMRRVQRSWYEPFIPSRSQMAGTSDYATLEDATPASAEAVERARVDCQLGRMVTHRAPPCATNPVRASNCIACSNGMLLA